MAVVRDAVRRNLSGRYRIRLPHINSMLRSALSSNLKEFCRSPAGPGCQLLAVFPDGGVYPCHCVAGSAAERLFRMGSVFSSSDWRSLKHNSQAVLSPQQRTVESISKCRACPLKRICGGGDFNESYQAFGRLDREAYMCRYYDIMFPWLIFLLCDDPKGVLGLMAPIHNHPRA